MERAGQRGRTIVHFAGLFRMKSVAEEPQVKARMAGLLYLLIFIAAPTNAASATIPTMIITLICDTAVAVIFYDLFKPVSRSLFIIAALFRFIFVTVMAVSSLNYFGYLALLNGVHSASAFMTGYLIARSSRTATSSGVTCPYSSWCRRHRSSFWASAGA
jgi:hypothetical protein